MRRAGSVVVGQDRLDTSARREGVSGARVHIPCNTDSTASAGLSCRATANYVALVSSFDFVLVRPPADGAGVGVGLGGGGGGDAGVMQRFVTRGVGRGGVAYECQRLAAAAAPVDLAPVARAAGLLHPFRAAEGLEGRIVTPDLGQRVLAHVPELEARNRFRCMAGQSLARGR